MNEAKKPRLIASPGKFTLVSSVLLNRVQSLCARALWVISEDKGVSKRYIAKIYIAHLYCVLCRAQRR